MRSVVPWNEPAKSLYLKHGGCPETRWEQWKFHCVEDRLWHHLKKEAHKLEPIGLIDALKRRRSIRDFTGDSVSLDSVQQILWSAVGITDANGNRTVPSAHAVRPLCFRLSAGIIDGLSYGVYNYDTENQRLEIVSSVDVRAMLKDAAIDDQEWIKSSACIISIGANMEHVCAAFARQSPFGRRGERYAYIEAGAAAQNMLLTSVAEKLGAVLVAGFDDDQTGRVLGFEPPIAPLLHICVGTPRHNR